MNKSISRSELRHVTPLEAIDPAPPQAPIVRIHLLGGMRATTFRGDDVLPRGRKARALLGCLCLADGRPVSRARISAALWDRVPEFQARASFRQAFRELMLAFGPQAGELVTTDRETMRLNTRVCWIDAIAMLTMKSSAEKSERSKLAALCKGELLEDLSGISVTFDQWLLGERTRYAEQLCFLMEQELKQAKIDNEGPSEREEIARRLIAFDQTHEGASRVLMRALADRGERALALREYERLSKALRLALDVAPSPETHALCEAIRMFSPAEEKQAIDLPAAPEQPKKKKWVEPPQAKRSRMRVGVMPFMAIRPAVDDNFALSLSQEIAAALARFRWFDVVAPFGLVRSPAPTFMKEDALARGELDYVVDGSIAVSGAGYHISVRLLDLTSRATPVWSSRFDLPADQLHLLDERVTAPIVAQIDPVILYIEGQTKRREEDDAISCVLLAIPLMYSMERQKYAEAGRLIDRALKLEPDNAIVLAWAAFWQVFHVGQGWATDRGAASTAAQDHALRAIQLDPGNAEALGIYAHVMAFLHRDYTTALYYFDRALELNRNLPFVWAFSAVTHCYVGDPDEALRRLKRCGELIGFQPYPALFQNHYSIAYLLKRQYEPAADVGRRVVENSPGYGNGYKPLISALGHLGQLKDAKLYVAKLLIIEPEFTVQQFAKVYPLKNQSDLEHYIDGLRRAGVPEG